METNQSERDDQRAAGTGEEGAAGTGNPAGQAAKRAGANAGTEAMETDGKGTGGMGADLGGYGAVPGSDATG